MVQKARFAYVQSARRSCDIHAYHDAARWAEKALNNWPKGEDESERLKILEDFAYCSKVSGNLNNAIKALKEATVSELASGNADFLASIYRELAACYGLKGAWNNYQHSRQKAIELYLQAGNFADAALEQMDLAEYLFKETKITIGLKKIEEALTHSGKAGRKDVYARCLALKGYLLAYSGNTIEGFELANSAVQMGLDQNNTLVTAEAYRRLAGTLEYASSFKESLNAYDVAFQFCSTHQLDFQESLCLSCMSFVLFRTGDWRKCFEAIRTVLEHPGSINLSKCTANLILALIRAYRGEIRTAGKNLNETLILAGKEGSTLHKMLACWPASIIALVEGKQDEAYTHFCEMINVWSETEDRHDSIAGFCDAISFFSMNNHTTELNRCLHALSQIANETKNPEAFGIMSFAIGNSLYLNNDFTPAADHLEKAIEYLIPVNIPLQTAIIQFHAGLCYVKLQQQARAKTQFHAAYQTFKNLGIRYWCSIIDNIKQSTFSINNDPTNTPSFDMFGSDSLTGRQLEILSLLTTGLSNKEIASKVNLSTRTVDMHVRNIYDRLNCRTRTEATRIAFDKGIIKSRNA
jgi:DNA-binding CsgD family transcriptional regulator/tetratricopeptide (TPR) repeat protein